MPFSAFADDSVSPTRRSNRDASISSNIPSWRKAGLDDFSSPGRCDRGRVTSDWVESRASEKWPVGKVCVADVIVLMHAAGFLCGYGAMTLGRW